MFCFWEGFGKAQVLWYHPKIASQPFSSVKCRACGGSWKGPISPQPKIDFGGHLMQKSPHEAKDKEAASGFCDPYPLRWFFLIHCRKLQWVQDWMRSCRNLRSPCVTFFLWLDPFSRLYHANDCQLKKQRDVGKMDAQLLWQIYDRVWWPCSLLGKERKDFFRDYNFVCRGSVKSVAGRTCTAFINIGEMFSPGIKVLIFASLLSFPLPLCISLAFMEVSVSQYIGVFKDSDVFMVYITTHHSNECEKRNVNYVTGRNRKPIFWNLTA